MQPQDQVEDVVDHLRREAERRLVEQQQLRRRHQGPGDRQLLLLAAGQGAGRLAAPLGEDREELEHLLRGSRATAAAIAPARGAEAQILGDREDGEDAPPLRHQRHAAGDDGLGVAAGDVVAGETRLRRSATRTSPTTALSVVVLPAPLAPSRATISPSVTSRSTPRTAWMAP